MLAVPVVQDTFSVRRNIDMMGLDRRQTVTEQDTIEIQWTSTAKLIEELREKYSSLVRTISVRVGPKSMTSELFQLGKFLSILLYLKTTCGKKVHVVVENTERANSKYGNLVRLGFLDLLRTSGISFSIVRPKFRDDAVEILEFQESNDLVNIPESEEPNDAVEISKDRIRSALDATTGYNCIVVPFSARSFHVPYRPKASDHQMWVESETDAVVSHIVTEINTFVENQIDVKPEIAKAVLPIIRELVSNCIQHSPRPEESDEIDGTDSGTQHQILYAVAYSRENKTAPRSAGRVSAGFEGWADKFDILVQDVGQGVLHSVRQTFGNSPQPVQQTLRHEFAQDTSGVLAEEDLVGRLWGEEMRFEDQYKERQFLSTVFRGNLVVRKGRKSLGLQSIASICMTQNGCLNFHSGITEVLVGELGGALHVTPREKKDLEYWLPGVIAAVFVPIHGMKVARARTRLANVRHNHQESLFSEKQTQPTPAIKLVIQPSLPKGLFGGLSRIKSTRRSETDAIQLLMKDAPSQCQVIDLKASGAIDIDFLDSLIQEMCKSGESFGGEGELRANRRHPFAHRIFINVPSSVVSALKARNCNSFLIENGMICLMTDEHDQPHFLGIKRATTKADDLEDLLVTIYMSANTGISESDLRRIGFSEEVLGLARPLFPVKTERDVTPDQSFTLYFRLLNDDGWYYVWRSVALALWRKDAVRAREIGAFTHKLANAWSQLSNGILIDTTYDFPRFWSDDRRLRICAKWLSRKAGFPLVKQIISFKGNGDVLAGAIRELLGASELLLLDVEHIEDDFGLIGSNAMLVVDTLFPGDGRSDSYVGRSVEEMLKKAGSSDLIVLAFANMARETMEKLDSCQVFSLKVKGSSAPKTSSEINPGTAIYGAKQIHEHFTPNEAGGRDGARQLSGQWSTKFSPLELSSEFWHNVAELKIISGQKQRGDSRQLLYFEDNEAVIRHPRLREQLHEFVENFVRNILELRLEVILHPKHSTGAYLAHLVAKNLTISPLILPLTQWKYGGPIQVSSNEFRHLQDQIRDLRSRHEDRQPRCLVVDDSILTGSSIFTMLGLASQLDIKPVGILVLINRLKPEVSEALSLLPLSFAYFFRFHIPKLEDQEEPNAKLAKLDREFDEQSQNDGQRPSVASSYFAKFWSKSHIQPDEGSDIRNHLQRDIKEIHLGPPRIADPETLVNDIKDKTALQIIHRLLLHPDTRTIDFPTRIAIVFNFLDRLLDADRKFEFLSRLHQQGKTENQYSQTNQLLRKILFLLAFSRPVMSSTDNERLTERCSEFVGYYMSDYNWQSHKSVVCEAIMCLGALSSTRLLDILLQSVELGIIEAALNAFSVSIDEVSEKASAAADVCGSLSWATAVLLRSKRKSLDKQLISFSPDLKQRIAHLVGGGNVSMEQRFFLIETLFPAIQYDNELQNAFDISVTADKESILETVGETTARAYLTGAPGYTVTLRIALHLFSADCIFLIAWTKSDETIQLKGFESRIRGIKPNHEIDKWITGQSRQKILHGLYFQEQHPNWLNGLLELPPDAAPMIKCFGAAVASQDGLNYYVLAAYKDSEPSIPTAYYYWLRYEPQLRGILHSIHDKYVQSSITWELLRTSHKVFHLPRSGTTRRDALRAALVETPVGNLLNEVVALYSHKPLTVTEAYEVVGKVNDQLEENIGDDRNHPLRYQGTWPVKCMPPAVPDGQKEAYIAFSVPVLKFILLECLCNATSFLQSSAKIRFNYCCDDVPKPIILVEVTNDISKEQVSEHHRVMGDKRKGTGVIACQTAAAAAGGSFQPDRKLTSESNAYTATITLPVHAMPKQLWRFMQ